MKKLNLRLIEKDESLRSRLKDAARDSVRNFLSGKDPPEDALDYVFAALCLGETSEQFNARLQQLFEKDCSVIVESLRKFLEQNPEFIVSTVPTDSKTETKKETTKSKRSKIIWDSSLEKPSANESSTNDDKNRRTENREQSSIKEITTVSTTEPTTGEARRPKHSSSVSGAKDTNTEKLIDRWQLETTEDSTEYGTTGTSGVDIKTAPSGYHRMSRTRLFQSALGSIKQQFGKKEKTVPDSRSNVHSEIAQHGRRQERVIAEDHHSVLSQKDTIREGSILDRIRKPDGSAFEEWELKRDVLPTRKRHAEPHLDPEPIGDVTPDVQSGQVKVSRLEKKPFPDQEPSLQNTYPIPPHLRPPPLPAQNFDRKSVCVKNVHFLANEEVIAAHFHSCQPIADITIAKDQYDRPKGFCFIEFRDEECVSKALELDQSLLLGRQIAVIRKLTRPPAPSPIKPYACQEWNRGQWLEHHTQMLPSSSPMIREERDNRNTTTTVDDEDILDFAIDTGSQEMP